MITCAFCVTPGDCVRLGQCLTFDPPAALDQIPSHREQIIPSQRCALSTEDILAQVGEEIDRTVSLGYGDFNSAHEGYAILLEEVDELWDHVKISQRKRDLGAMYKEAIQVAAMAVKFVRNLPKK